MTLALDRPAPIDDATRRQFLIGAAYAFSTALSLPVALDGLAPQLAAAVDGNPATMVGQR